jgi:sigma-B regulation protein RsbU (phosphoserine phosphatase)
MDWLGRETLAAEWRVSMTETAPYEIHCAEIWGGASVKEGDVATPAVRAAIHSSASGAAKGGDLYYFSVCAYDTLTRIAIADVRGHGEAVSHLSEWLYQSLEARMNDSDGASVLTDLNAIVRDRGFEAITTAVVATFHRDKGLLYYSYAGHPPLMLGRTGHDWKPLEAEGGLPLGILPNAKYQQEQIRVEPGDRLFFYTDGVAECPGPDEALFGDEQMSATLNRSNGAPLSEIRRNMRDGLTNYAGGSLEHDDTTFLLVEVLKPPPFWKRRLFAGKPRAIGATWASSYLQQ